MGRDLPREAELEILESSGLDIVTRQRTESKCRAVSGEDIVDITRIDCQMQICHIE